MAEPEELLIEVAHRGVSAARRVWQGRRSGAGGERLDDLRPHLELVLAGLADRSVRLRPADPPAPPSWVARLARRTPRFLRLATPTAGTDGESVLLPRTLPSALIEHGGEPALAYRVLLAGQVARIRRGSTGALPRDASPLERTLYELAESVAADAWIAGALPGLVPGLVAARRASLADRPPLTRLRSAERAVEALLRCALASRPGDDVTQLPRHSTALESRAWALRMARDLAARPHDFRGLPPALCWGRLHDPPTPGIPPSEHPAIRPSDSGPQRASPLRRTPDVRAPHPGEDDAEPGTWVIRADEPLETAEDPFGLSRPLDRDDDAEPDELGDGLADLPETRVVTTPTPPHEALLAERPVPRAPRIPVSGGVGLVYPEWDWRAGAYRARGAVVRERAIAAGDEAWADAALALNARLIRRVRRWFAALRPRRARLRRQLDGTDLDLEAWVELWADREAGTAAAPGYDRLYQTERHARRGLAIALLVDVSASTDAWVTGRRRVIDVEKEALLVVTEALERLGDRYAVYAFSGEGPESVSIQVVKAFAEPGGRRVAIRIGGLAPDRYTRVGAAVRHATRRLADEPADRRLLLVLTDGRPNDVDEYEGRYGMEDTRQALREAARQDILAFGLAVDRSAPGWLAGLFGRGRAALVKRPEMLPAALVDVLRRLLSEG